MEENRSLWQEESLPDFPVLEGDTETEVLIIGGGLCGILTAYTLLEKGIRATVIEADNESRHSSFHLNPSPVQHSLVFCHAASGKTDFRD